MRIPPRAWVLLGLSVLAIAGFTAPELAGQAGAYAWLGVFPGMAVARLLLPRAAGVTRWTLGLALSPLVSAGAGWALERGGLGLPDAARLVGAAGWLLFAGGEMRGLAARADDPDAPPDSRFAWGWSLAGVAFVVAVLAVNPFSLIRHDAWVHAAVIGEIRLHGAPPVDPRFVGLPLNYVWIFHYFVAQLVSIGPSDPFVAMALLNVVTTGVMFWLVWTLAWAVRGDERSARGTLALRVGTRRVEITSFRAGDPGGPIAERIESDLRANLHAFRDLIIDIGFAKSYADGRTIITTDETSA